MSILDLPRVGGRNKGVGVVVADTDKKWSAWPADSTGLSTTSYAQSLL